MASRRLGQLKGQSWWKKLKDELGGEPMDAEAQSGEQGWHRGKSANGQTSVCTCEDGKHLIDKWMTMEDDSLVDRIINDHNDAIELRALVDLQWRREMEVVSRWREEGKVLPLTLPDHAKAFDWLLEEVNALSTAKAALREIADVDSTKVPATTAASWMRDIARAALDRLAQSSEGESDGDRRL